MSQKCSVVIPTYNEEKYIRGLLESLRNQSVPAHEIIMVDASNDTTRAIASEFGVKVLNQDVRRVAWARRRGFDAATGDIIISTDADSVLASNYIENTIIEFNNQSIGAIFGPVHLADGPLLFRIASRTLFSLFLRLSLLIGKPNLNGMNFAVRREVYDKAGGFNPEYVTAEDVELGLRIRKVSKIAYSSNVLVHTSARRVTGMGGRKFMWHHTLNFIKMSLGKKGSDNFKPYR